MAFTIKAMIQELKARGMEDSMEEVYVGDYLFGRLSVSNILTQQDGGICLISEICRTKPRGNVPLLDSFNLGVLDRMIKLLTTPVWITDDSGRQIPVRKIIPPEENSIS